MQGPGNPVFIIAACLTANLAAQLRVGIAHNDTVRKACQHFQIVPIIAEDGDFIRLQTKLMTQMINALIFAGTGV